MKILLFIFIISSCSTLKTPKAPSPSWVEGIRNGTESLRIINGNKVFYRRILKANKDSEQETCEKVLGMAASDIQKEFLIDTKIPYTLEYLHFDDDFDDCSVTLSISTQLTSRLMEIKEITNNHKEIVSDLEDRWIEARKDKEKIEIRNRELEAYIRQNQHLLSKYDDYVSNVNKAWAMLKDKRQRASESALTGLSKNEFKRLVGHEVTILFSTDTPCWNYFRSSDVSYHGTTIVCWTEKEKAFIQGYCDAGKGTCLMRNP
jgi:hypothetical protein